MKIGDPPKDGLTLTRVIGDDVWLWRYKRPPGLVDEFRLTLAKYVHTRVLRCSKKKGREGARFAHYVIASVITPSQ